MRVALYLRVSTGEQTTANQRSPLENLARARGWEPVVYEEVGSATRVRPVFERMLEDARHARVRAVLVVALDRLGRNLVDVVATVRELDRVGCAVVSVRESWLDTSGPARGLLIAVFAWVAEEELRILKERTRAGLERAKRQGARLGRPPAPLLNLGMGERMVRAGASIASAARAAGVSKSALHRHLVRADRPENPPSSGNAPPAGNQGT